MTSPGLAPGELDLAAMGRPQVYLSGKRLVALTGLAAATYVVVGSWIFGDWWYIFFWEGGYRQFKFITDALRVLLDEHFPLVIGIIGCFFVAIVVGMLLRRRLFSFTDRFAGLIVFVALMTILTDAVVLYHTRREQAIKIAAMIADFDESYKKLGATFTPPKIEPPIYFHYLDRRAVEALYNQIQPELEEKERTVMGSKTLKGKAGAGFGGASAEVEGGKANESKSTFGRTEFSPDRKCVDVMRYVRETWPANYYSTDTDWYWMKAWKNIDRQRQALWGMPSDFRITSTPEDMKREPRRTGAQWQAELKNELQLVRGFVFVDGEFENSVNSDSAIFVENFSKSPFKASFRVFLPKKVLQALPGTRPLHLKVFGDVTKSLGDDGFVDISAVAVY